jgi:hypothetical protein
MMLMAPGYDAEEFGAVMLRAKEDAVFTIGWQTISVKTEYVERDEHGEKFIRAATQKSISFTTSGDREYTLIDLSDMIDWFGTDSTDPEWDTKYIFFDFDNNGEIDIYDIAFVARLIGANA